ncbi:NADH oxidase [Atopobacter sp. AH10]|uniref:FAD-dependent oxidoreductase n=1 Tax=Atopobacter sp. AH10 TaxID=2315861 RepID=UPI000EF1EFA9|nr:FAD-dependent oxidoreductase [Atopobacter sp. AH10]RLK64198.1 NADH oxidase [Atopobacter sp. AH10]
MKVVVIGCTHAGTAAVKTILADHPSAEVKVYERNDNISFLSCGIALYIAGQVKDPQGLFYSSPEELKKLGAQVHMRHDVLNVNVADKTILVKDLLSGEEFVENYDKLIVTTGSWPIIPDLDGLDLENVQLCKNYQHAKDIFSRQVGKKKVVIVGAGYIGIELVEAFRRQGSEVTLIDAQERILNKYLDKEITDILEAKLIEEGVQLKLNEKVKAFLGEKGKVSAVQTSKASYPADLVVLCIGFRPNTDLVKGQVETLANGAIIVDDYMQTSVKDVYAAGDSCAVNYNPNNGHAYIPLATNAVRMGFLVGKNIVGEKMKYRGTQATSGLYLYGYNIGATGVTEASAREYGLDVDSVYLEDNYRPEFMPSTEKVYMKLVYEKESKRIVGGQMMSKYDVTQSANTLSLAIQTHQTVEDLALVDFFFQPVYDRPFNYLNILAQAALAKEN